MIFVVLAVFIPVKIIYVSVNRTIVQRHATYTLSFPYNLPPVTPYACRVVRWRLRRYNYNIACLCNIKLPQSRVLTTKENSLLEG